MPGGLHAIVGWVVFGLGCYKGFWGGMQYSVGWGFEKWHESAFLLLWAVTFVPALIAVIMVNNKRKAVRQALRDYAAVAQSGEVSVEGKELTEEDVKAKENGASLNAAESTEA